VATLIGELHHFALGWNGHKVAFAVRSGQSIVKGRWWGRCHEPQSRHANARQNRQDPSRRVGAERIYHAKNNQQYEQESKREKKKSEQVEEN
jgi:hypothetical protein